MNSCREGEGERKEGKKRGGGERLRGVGERRGGTGIAWMKSCSWARMTLSKPAMSSSPAELHSTCRPPHPPSLSHTHA